MTNDPEDNPAMIMESNDGAIARDVSVISRSVEKFKAHPRKLPQYIAGVSSTLGALAAGLVYGWTSAAGEDGVNLAYDSFDIDSNDFSWISSIVMLGAAATCIPTGILANLIGRRRTMLATIIPFVIGWACVIWPNSLATLVLGRFLLGASGGAFCVAAPMYTAEIADRETRGRLGSCFELLICSGILLAYALGLIGNMNVQSMISAIVPIVFFAIFFFMPETPTYHLMRGNVKAARETLVWLRGEDYDIESELAEQQKTLGDADEQHDNDCVSLISALGSRAAVKGIFIGYGLMFFQTFSGIDAIIFYGNGIFRDATASDNYSDWSTIVTGTMKVVAVFSFTLVADRWGRRTLLAISGTLMCLSTLILGTYFYLDNDNNGTTMNELRWLPIVCVCSFNISASFGFDPIPWMMMGELFSPRIKATAGSSACLLNWLMAFVVTKYYSVAKRQIGSHGTYWIFSAISGLGVLFVIIVVPETRGKSLDQIQMELRESSKECGERGAGNGLGTIIR